MAAVASTQPATAALLDDPPLGRRRGGYSSSSAGLSKDPGFAVLGLRLEATSELAVFRDSRRPLRQ